MRKRKARKKGNVRAGDSNIRRNAGDQKELHKQLDEIKKIISADESFGMRAAKRQREMGLWGSALGVGISFAIVTVIPREHAFIIMLPLWLLIFAFACQAIAGQLFESTFKRNSDLLAKINDIGGYRLPFGPRWQRQWKAGICSTVYRVALIFESSSYVFMCLSLVFIIRLYCSGRGA